MTSLESLKNLVLAPYILKATALISVQREVGGNQFRHCFSTLGILLDYKFYTNSVLLKASLLHDLFEDLPETQIDEVRWIDSDGADVVNLVLEVTRRKDETKEQYLQRVLMEGSGNAHLLKCADRISNLTGLRHLLVDLGLLTDLHRDTQSEQKISDYLDQTEKYVFPMARKVNDDMLIELTDLVARRRKIIRMLEYDRNHGGSPGD